MINIRVSSPKRAVSPLNQSVNTNSSGNLPAHNVKLERSPESIKHLGDYLPNSPKNKKPPKPKKFQYSKDFEKEKKNPRNQWDRASKLHYLRLSKGIRQPSAIEIQANYGEVSVPKRFNKVSRTPGIIPNRYGSISNLRLRDEE